MRNLFAAIVMIHGILHVLVFAKASPTVRQAPQAATNAVRQFPEFLARLSKIEHRLRLTEAAICNCKEVSAIRESRTPRALGEIKDD